MVVRQGHPAVVVAPPPQLVAHRRIKQGDCSKGKGRGKGKGKSRDKIDESLAAHAFNAGAAAAYEQRQRQNRDHPNASCAIISCSVSGRSISRHFNGRSLVWSQRVASFFPPGPKARSCLSPSLMNSCPRRTTSYPSRILTTICCSCPT